MGSSGAEAHGESSVSLQRRYTWSPLDLANFRRLGSFSAFSRFVLDAGGIIERSVAFPVNVRMMDEEIVATIVGGNEAIPLLVIEPLYRTCCHLLSPLALRC